MYAKNSKKNWTLHVNGHPRFDAHHELGLCIYIEACHVSILRWRRQFAAHIYWALRGEVASSLPPKWPLVSGDVVQKSQDNKFGGFVGISGWAPQQQCELSLSLWRRGSSAYGTMLFIMDARIKSQPMDDFYYYSLILILFLFLFLFFSKFCWGFMNNFNIFLTFWVGN